MKMIKRKIRMDKYTEQALNTYKPSTKAVYKYYLIRLLAEHYPKTLIEISVDDLTKHSRKYKHPEIVLRMLFSLKKKAHIIKSGGKLWLVN